MNVLEVLNRDAYFINKSNIGFEEKLDTISFKKALV